MSDMVWVFNELFILIVVVQQVCQFVCDYGDWCVDFFDYDGEEYVDNLFVGYGGLLLVCLGDCVKQVIIWFSEFVVQYVDDYCVQC